MSEQQWYCPNCGPEISVTVERIHTFSGPDDYIVCTGCGETVDEKAETPAFVIALQQRIAALEAALMKIQNPLKALQDEAKAQGYRINGAMAVQLCDSAAHLKQIAGDALRAAGYLK